MTPAVSYITQKYSNKEISNIKKSIQELIEKEKNKKNFFKKFTISKKDFRIFEDKAYDLSWLTNQEINSIIEYGTSLSDKLKFTFHRFRFNFLPSIRVSPDVPAYLLIEPTSICNMRCPMCFQTDKSFTSNEFMGKMDFNFFKSIIDEAEYEGIGSITLASRGEPSLHPKLIEMLEYSKNKFFEMKMNTNASRLTSNLSRAMLSTLDHVVFSIDSHILEEYESIRVGGKFNEVFENVKNFWEIRNSEEFINKKIRVSISGIKVKDSQDPESFKLFWEKYSDDAYLNPAEERWNTYFNKKHPEIKKSCIYPWERLYIWHDGQINTCDVDYKSELSPGNIKELGGIKKAWKRLDWLRKKHLNGLRDSVLPCDRCGVSH
mgnify:CR=1 FL=1|tara:strand:- start:305 stop:1432 length:1128 start_codon:yes stop_codon:yes gene_type:complete